MSSRRQKSSPLGGRCRQVSLYLQNVTLENILYIYLCFIFVFPCAVYCWLSTWYIDWLYQIARMEPFPITNKGSRSYGVWQYWMTNQYPVCIKMSATNTCGLFVFLIIQRTFQLQHAWTVLCVASWQAEHGNIHWSAIIFCATNFIVNNIWLPPLVAMTAVSISSWPWVGHAIPSKYMGPGCLQWTNTSRHQRHWRIRDSWSQASMVGSSGNVFCLFVCFNGLMFI